MRFCRRCGARLSEPLAFSAHTVPMLGAVADLVDGRLRALPDRTW